MADRAHTGGRDVVTAQLPGPSPETLNQGREGSGPPFPHGSPPGSAGHGGAASPAQQTGVLGDVRLQEEARPGRHVQCFPSPVSLAVPGGPDDTFFWAFPASWTRTCSWRIAGLPASATGCPHRCTCFPCVCVWGPQRTRAGYPAVRASDSYLPSNGEDYFNHPMNMSTAFSPDPGTLIFLNPNKPI